MKGIFRFFAILAAFAVFVSAQVSAQELPADVKAKIDKILPTLKGWAAEAAVLDAVKAHNAAPSAEYASMNQDQWKALTVLAPQVRNFTKNAAAAALKGKKTEYVSEMILSGADGTKVAFLSKPTNWSHKGKAKHDVPMSGKDWFGNIEVDESTGQQQVQVSVPVLDGGKPIGSLIVGLVVSKL